MDNHEIDNQSETTETEYQMPKSRMDEADRLMGEHDFEHALDIYRQCAEEGIQLSKCRMGVMYYEGLGVDKRPIKAFKLIEESYDPECPETEFQLGKCHFVGIGTPKNEELGFEMIISAAEKGHPEAENYVAALYFDGEYVQKDPKKGLSWLEKAVSHNDPKALYNMGNFLYQGKYVGTNTYKAVEMWKRSADLHYVPALGRLGFAYLKDKSKPEKVEKGLRYLEEAASLGDGISAERLGDYHRKEKEDEDWLEKSVKYYKIALKNGRKNVLFDLGMAYRHYKDEDRIACRYFHDGHMNGDICCSFEYAYMKLFGIGTDTDEEEAFKAFLYAAEKGHDRSMGFVGHCYYEGAGVNPNERKAREWFERGHVKGNAYCTYRLAEFYFCGVTVHRDPDYGLKLLREAFDKGEKMAAYRLGDVYENHSKLKSIPDAIYWYMQGAEHNECDCMMRLAHHYESGSFIQKSDKKAYELYRAANDISDSSISAAELGRCFEEGIGVDADINAATGWYLKAVRDNSFAMWRLYHIYLGKGDADAAVFWLRRSASKGSVSAMNELAMRYEEGKLVPKSDYHAMSWYNRASDGGNEEAKERFEELIRFDPEEPYFEGYDGMAYTAGEEDDDDSIMFIADTFADGDEVPKDLIRARTWYNIGNQLHLKGAKEGLKKVESMLKAEKRNDGKQTTLD